MKIVFPHVETWDGSNDQATFPANVDGERMLCRISWEALTDHFGGDRGGDPVEPMRANRITIETKAEALIRAGHFEEDGSVLLRTSDF
jgi:hypothetical protein